MIVTAWNRGNYLPSGGGYGLSFHQKDRDQYLQRDWGEIRLLVEEPGIWAEANLDKECFWDDDLQIVNKSIGQWLLKCGYAPWPTGHPPKFLLTHLQRNEFKVTPHYLPDGLPCHERINLEEWQDFQKAVMEGRWMQKEVAVRQRCEALINRLKDYFRDPITKLISCVCCQWTRPAAGFSGDIVHIHHHDAIANAPREGRLITWEQAKVSFSPLCPTCHALIHARPGGGCYSIADLQQRLANG